MQGPKGDPGSDANVTAANIEAALGYVPVKDVQVAGTSALADGVANVPIASATKPGVIKVASAQMSGMYIENDGLCYISFATHPEIDSRTAQRKTVVCYNLDYAVKAAMCDGKGAAWTSAEQKAARERMGADGDYVLIESLSLAEAVTRFERNSEPDGTPYNLSALKVIVKFIPGQGPGAFFLIGYDGSGSRIVGGSSESISMVPEGSPSNYRSTATFDAKPLFGLYDCTAQGRQGSAMTVTRSANGNYQLISTESKIAKFMFYLYNNGEIPMIAGTEIQIYGVRA